jgi:hypothetical protein
MDPAQKEYGELPPILQAIDIQNYLGIGKNQAYDLCNSGQFHVVKIGRLIRVKREVFVRWLNGEDKEEKQG